MALDANLRAALGEAVKCYDFPCVTYDFTENCETTYGSMRDVERQIRTCLFAGNITSVKAGLSNVLYWGYARVGYRDRRVSRFREEVTDGQLARAGRLFRRLRGPGMMEIAHLDLPEFSGLSFVSKVRMFLDPTEYVTLDQKLLRIRHEPVWTVLSDVSFSESATTIRASKANEEAYEQWCKLCRKIARAYFQETDLRAVDVERAIFHLVQSNETPVAAQILARA